MLEWIRCGMPLVWTHLIEIFHTVVDDTAQMAQVEDQDMIETFSADGATKAFSECIGIRCLDTRTGSHPTELGSKLAIIIPHQIFGSFTKRGRCA